MLTDEIIIQIIKEYEREFAILRKDCDAFHKRLAAKLLNTVDDEKEYVLEWTCKQISDKQLSYIHN
jgi:hypothetical protein